MARTTNCLIGAIRWPAFTSDRSTFIVDYLGSPSGVTINRVFTDYGHRAPSLWDNYAQWGPGFSSQRIQEIVDSELLAANGSLDFFSYNWYPPVSTFSGDPSNKPSQSDIMIPAEAHFTSPYKTLVKAMFMVHPAWWSMNTMPLSIPDNFGRATSYRTHMVSHMQDSAYFRFGGRPVLGVYGYATYPSIQATFLAEIDALVTELNEPIYILVQDQSQTAATAMLSRGCKWKTTYGPNPGPSPQVNGTQYPWENQRASDVTQWTWPGGGIQYFMSLTPCNDRRPRGAAPATWWVDQPTMPEWQRHIAASFIKTQSGFGTVTPEIGMIYSWDEIDEGGPGIAPTFQERRRYLDALKWVRTGQYPESYLYELDAAQLNFTTSGTWTKSAQTPGMFNNDEITSSTTNEYVDFTHERCQHLGVLATMGPDRGIANIYIDSILAGTADLYAVSTSYQNQVFMSNRLGGGTHTIRVEVSGTKNASSSSNKIGYDACRIIYNP